MERFGQDRVRPAYGRLTARLQYAVEAHRSNLAFARFVGEFNRGETAPMKISAKTEYACIAMLELAATYGSGEPVRIRSIAEEHGIPQRFLVQILLQLKGAGLVTSTRGAAGGYQLAVPPEEISLGQVMQTIEGAPSEPTSSASPDSVAGVVLQRVWREVAEVQESMLNEVTFGQLVERARKESENMYYI